MVCAVDIHKVLHFALQQADLPLHILEFRLEVQALMRKQLGSRVLSHGSLQFADSQFELFEELVYFPLGHIDALVQAPDGTCSIVLQPLQTLFTLRNNVLLELSYPQA